MGIKMLTVMYTYKLWNKSSAQICEIVDDFHEYLYPEKHVKTIKYHNVPVQ